MKKKFRFWEQGHVASEGMNNIAQNGVTSTLESELKSKVKLKYYIIPIIQPTYSINLLILLLYNFVPE